VNIDWNDWDDVEGVLQDLLFDFQMYADNLMPMHPRTVAAVERALKTKKITPTVKRLIEEKMDWVNQ